MKIIITIECDNAAFDGGRKYEVARILREAAKDIWSGGIEERKLRDHNGNTVGQVEVEG